VNSPYAKLATDFQRCLQDILDATKKGDKQRVASLLTGTEVPNCDVWLHQMYKTDSADSQRHAWNRMVIPTPLAKEIMARTQPGTGTVE